MSTEDKIKCPLCDGLGYREEEVDVFDEGTEDRDPKKIGTEIIRIDCQLCEGTGKVDEKDQAHYRTHGYEEHPSWGVIMMNHSTATHGGRTRGGVRLFDSEIPHNRIVTLRIQLAQRQRDLHQDHIMEAHQPTIVEVAMSQAQWGAAVSSFGTSGVPCTIWTRDGRRVEQEEFEQSRLELTADEVLQKARTAVVPVATAFRELEDLVERNAGKKAIKEAMSSLRAQIQNLPKNAQFAADQLSEHAETVVAKARADIEGMVTAHAVHLGLDPGETLHALELDGITTSPPKELER
jgi:hypothetical protein